MSPHRGTRRRYYIGLVHKDRGSDFGVSFPDFPGAVTAARTVHEALEAAEEVLQLHVDGMLAEGESIPDLSTFDELPAKSRDGVSVLVPLRTDALAMPVQVTLPAPVLRRIDKHVEQWGQSRSGFLTEAAKHELARAPSGRRVAAGKRKR